MTSRFLLRRTRHSVAIATASLLPLSAWSQAVTPPVVDAAKRLDGGNTAWMLVATLSKRMGKRASADKAEGLSSEEEARQLVLAKYRAGLR
jgi:hypothetical protein